MHISPLVSFLLSLVDARKGWGGWGKWRWGGGGGGGGSGGGGGRVINPFPVPFSPYNVRLLSKIKIKTVCFKRALAILTPHYR